MLHDAKFMRMYSVQMYRGSFNLSTSNSIFSAPKWPKYKISFFVDTLYIEQLISAESADLILSYDWSVSLKLCFDWLLKEEF